MKTPMRKLLNLELDLTLIFDSDERVAMALLDHLRTNRNKLLEDERDIMVDFAYKCRNLMAVDEFAINHWYEKTFNTKEK